MAPRMVYGRSNSDVWCGHKRYCCWQLEQFLPRIRSLPTPRKLLSGPCRASMPTRTRRVRACRGLSVAGARCSPRASPRPSPVPRRGRRRSRHRAARRGCVSEGLHIRRSATESRARYARCPREKRHQSRSALAVSSGPLSQRMNSGERPRVAMIRAGTATVRSASIPSATLDDEGLAGTRRRRAAASSILLLAAWSNWKSTAHS